MNSEEHDELWELLGRAKTPQPSPFFSRNVLRAIREEAPARRGFFAWLKRPWPIAATLAACLAVIGAATLYPTDEKTDDLLLAAHEVSSSPDFQVISNLDELLDSEQNSVWLEASAY